MKLPANCRIELCASDDTTRPVLAHPYLDMLDPEKPLLVATDGRRIAILPVTVEEGECSGWVSTDALTAARKSAGKRGIAQIHCNGACETGGVRYPRPELGKFPNWRMVIPKPEGKTVRLGINPRLLVELAKALGSEECVTLEMEVVPEGYEHAGTVMSGMKVTPSKESRCQGAFGVIMPIRIS